jgi:hypothetical protein
MWNVKTKTYILGVIIRSEILNYINTGEAQMDEQTPTKREDGEFKSPLLCHFMAP